MKPSCFVRGTWLVLHLIAGYNVLLISGQASSSNETVQPDEYFSWKNLNWNFDDEESEDYAIKTGAYKRNSGIPGGFAIWRDKIFITVPRLRPGIPATLNYVRNTRPRVISPKLIPYPSWSFNDPENCDNTIISAYRIEVDECDRLWVIDTGTMVLDNIKKMECRPKLIVFDLLTDQLMRYEDLPPESMPSGTFIANLVVDADSTNCDDTFAYGSNLRSDSLTVYDWHGRISWLVPIKQIERLRPIRTGYYIYGMALSYTFESEGKRLFFHPFNRYQEYSVSTRILRNTKMTTSGLNKFMKLVRYSPGYGSSMVNTWGITFYSDNFSNAIRCRNTESNNTVQDESHGIVTNNNTTLNFPNDIKIYGDTLWILSNRLPEFLQSTLDFADTNFRLSKLSLAKINFRRICGAFV